MQPEVSTPATPLFQLTLQTLEPIFKTWVKDVLKSSAPVPVPDQQPEFYTRHDVCRILHLSLPTIDRYTDLRILEGKKIGSRVLYSKEAINEALNSISERKFKRK